MWMFSARIIVQNPNSVGCLTLASSSLYDSEEKISRTNLVEVLLAAKEAVFTVTFHKKVQEKDVQDALASIKTDSQMKKEAKALSKDNPDFRTGSFCSYVLSELAF